MKYESMGISVVREVKDTLEQHRGSLAICWCIQAFKTSLLACVPWRRPTTPLPPTILALGEHGMSLGPTPPAQHLEGTGSRLPGRQKMMNQTKPPCISVMATVELPPMLIQDPPTATPCTGHLHQLVILCFHRIMLQTLTSHTATWSLDVHPRQSVLRGPRSRTTYHLPIHIGPLRRWDYMLTAM
jgi:hypothetical protein